MSSFDAYLELSGTISGEVLADEPMSRHTSYRIGGPADLFITLDSYSDVTPTLDALARHGVPWVILGKGSNLLVSDEGYRGAVLVLGKEFNRFAFGEDGELSAGAAVNLARLVQAAYSKGYTGLEPLVGVPGTVGGAASMNAGTRKEWISSVIESLVVYRPGEGLVRYRASDIDWYYRCSTLPAHELILELVMKLDKGNEQLIRSKMEASLSRRKRTQPLNKPSCGSVFKNPPGVSVGKMIDDLGLKGQVCGGAKISEVHANFIVNDSKAKAKDVLSLIRLVRERVAQEHGIELHTELKFLGFEPVALR